MTTITKVFVILVCLFALIFTPLAIQFAARTHDWQKAAKDLRDQAEASVASERSSLAMAASQVEYYKDQLRTQQGKLDDAGKKIAALEGERDKFQQRSAELEVSRNNWENSASLLTNQMNVASQRNKELSDAREKSLERERELQTQNLQLADRVKDLSAQVTVLDQQNRQRVEELASFREENRKLRDQLKLGQAGQVVSAGTQNAVAATPAASGPVAGEVVQVNGNLATVNVGSASGVRPGMVVVVTRSGNYICDMEITSNVSPNEAVGRIMYEEPGRRIQARDRIQDATSFEARR